MYTGWWPIGAEWKERKPGVELSQPLKLFALSLLACMLLSGCGDVGGQDKLYRQVQQLAAQNVEANTLNVALSDLTDFDWDTAVVFKYPASGKEIGEALGVKYEGALDLTYGVFFVKDKEIVYEELFPKDFESLPRFMIYPHSGGDVGREPHFEVFTPNSVFTCTMTESDNDTRYSLKPNGD